jgi:hypothetical protein
MRSFNRITQPWLRAPGSSISSPLVLPSTVIGTSSTTNRWMSPSATLPPVHPAVAAAGAVTSSYHEAKQIANKMPYRQLRG